MSLKSRKTAWVITASLLLGTAHRAFAADALVVELSIIGGDSDVVFLLKDGAQYLIERSDLERLGVEGVGLVSVDQPDCESCVILSSLGEVAVDEDTATATLRLREDAVHRLPQRRLSLATQLDVRDPQRAVGFATNYTVSSTSREDEPLVTQGLLEGVFSLGRYGSIRHGQFVGETLNERVFTRYQYDFPGTLERLVIGDAVSNDGALGDASRFFGVSYSSDFTLVPGFREDLEYTFETAVTVPSSVDIYRNGDLIFQDEVDPGEVVIEDVFPVAGRNSIVIVVRDELGQEQVIQQELFDTRELLAPGQIEFAFDIGGEYEPGETDIASGLFVGQVRRGISEELTVDAYASARENDLFMSGGIDYATALGTVSLDAGGGAQTFTRGDEEASISRFVVQGSIQPSWPVVLGGFYFKEGQFDTYGASASTKFLLADGVFAATAGYIGEEGTGAISYERGFGDLSIGVEAKQSARDTIVSARLLFGFGQTNASVSHEVRDDRSLNRFGVTRSGMWDGRMSGGVLGSSTDQGEEEVGGFVGLNTNFGDFLARRDRNLVGENTTSVFAAGALVFGQSFQAAPARRLSPFDGMAVVDLQGLEGVDVRIGNRVVTTDAFGRAAAAVPAWRSTRVVVDAKTLPPGYSTGESERSIALYRGHIAVIEPPVNPPGFFLAPEAQVSEITVEGRRYTVYERAGAYVEVLPGRRTFVVGDEEFVVDVPEVGLDAPEFVLTTEGLLVERKYDE